MSQTLLEHIQQVDNAVLTDVVCQDQRSPEYKIIDWSVKALTTKGQQNPDGLHLIEGRGFDSRGETAWRIVVKNALPNPTPQPPGNLWYGKRELEFYCSGLPERIPGKMATPRLSWLL